MNTLRDNSRKDIRTRRDVPSMEELMLGCAQRIADAAELMAKDREELVRRIERDAFLAGWRAGYANASGEGLHYADLFEEAFERFSGIPLPGARWGGDDRND